MADPGRQRGALPGPRTVHPNVALAGAGVMIGMGGGEIMAIVSQTWAVVAGVALAALGLTLALVALLRETS
jgi:hypothetical protein